MIKSNQKIIGVNTHRANRIVEHGLKTNYLKNFNPLKILKLNLSTLMILDLIFCVISF